MTHALRTTVLLLMIGLSPGFAWGLSIGQKDTFQDGTTNGWGVSLLDISSPTPPVNMAGGGPAGAAPTFLKTTPGPGGGPPHPPGPPTPPPRPPPQPPPSPP